MEETEGAYGKDSDDKVLVRTTDYIPQRDCTVALHGHINMADR